MTVGSLFTGGGGLDLGLEAAGFRVAWGCENDPAARTVLADKRPDLDVAADVRDVDGGAPRVDWLAGGFPCQDLSTAGKGKGLSGERSGLWHEMARCVREIRPRGVLIENVPGILAKMGSRPGESAFGSVLADLAEIGYVGSWLRVSASDVGAPHRRDRVFVIATDSVDVAQRPRPGDVPSASRAREGEGQERQRVRSDARDGDGTLADAGRVGLVRVEAGDGEDGRVDVAGRDDSHGRALDPRGADDGHAREAVADADGRRRGQRHEGLGRVSVVGSGSASATAYADGGGRESWGGRRAQGGDHSRPGASERDGGRHVGTAEPRPWGVYEPAIRRWEAILGRPAPGPVDDRGRLEPRFVEWMLGYPDDWTAAVARTARLRILGNSVQVQVGEVVGHYAKGIAA